MCVHMRCLPGYTGSPQVCGTSFISLISIIYKLGFPQLSINSIFRNSVFRSGIIMFMMLVKKTSGYRYPTHMGPCSCHSSQFSINSRIDQIMDMPDSTASLELHTHTHTQFTSTTHTRFQFQNMLIALYYLCMHCS